MRNTNTKRTVLERFGEDRRGSFAVITGAIAAVLMLSAGYAVNTAQLYNVKSSLGNALDAAVTSTARDLTTGEIEPRDARGMVEIFLKANGDPEAALGDKFVLDTLVVDQVANTVEATAYVDVDLYFPLFGSSDFRRVRNASASVYSDKKIEVAMMLDVTGSMEKKGKKDKIGDLKIAAANAVELLLKNHDPKKPRVRVAIIPYAEAVNTGKLADQVFVEKKGGSNLPPAISDAVAASAKVDDDCATERKNKNGSADFSDDGPYTKRTNAKGKIYLAKVNRDDRLDICPEAELVALTADKDKLLDTIDDFKADGVTAGGIAAQWGYYMLSPKWRTAIKDVGMGSGPADHDEEKVSKVAILMTDGQFNTAFAGVKDSSDKDDQPQMDQGRKARLYAENICDNMKTDGIHVFTIGFDLSSSEKDEARAVLKDCASPDTPSAKHFFDVSTGEELDAAFKAIIANTERLALTK